METSTKNKIVYFILGVILTLAITTHHGHRGESPRNFGHRTEMRKVATIEVGAPLTVAQLKHYKFI